LRLYPHFKNNEARKYLIINKYNRKFILIQVKDGSKDGGVNGAAINGACHRPWTLSTPGGQLAAFYLIFLMKTTFR
jgi:hypothetical protein